MRRCEGAGSPFCAKVGSSLQASATLVSGPIATSTNSRGYRLAASTSCKAANPTPRTLYCYNSTCGIPSHRELHNIHEHASRIAQDYTRGYVLTAHLVTVAVIRWLQRVLQWEHPQGHQVHGTVDAHQALSGRTNYGQYRQCEYGVDVTGPAVVRIGGSPEGRGFRGILTEDASTP